MDAAAARQRWELENSVQPVGDSDELLRFNRQEQQTMHQRKPWAKDPHHFK
eukprot:evm.model.scf_1560.5 EVM.evm.TU.scf_1560.5   scf_1560:37088-37239(+)